MEKLNNIQFLNSIGRGIEKEGLRVTPQSTIAQTNHPAALGSALTHPSITTDYSEALLEFITPKMDDVDDTVKFLHDLHSFSLRNMGDDECIWPASMPCRLNGDESIPIAKYGSSNVGKMKNVYRQGLWHRYGRIMQSIAGIHYNFSMSNEFWSAYQVKKGNTDSLQDFKSASYFSLIRNFRRNSWLLYYLFGASPVVDKSFFNGREIAGLKKYGNRTVGLPYATSLRMSDIGYQNSVQGVLRVCYNRLETYIATLKCAVSQGHADYEKIGVKVDGEYKQLNTNILQLENEYYSDIRPKRVTESGEKPIHALQESGVEYIEVRVLDINPFLDVGIDAEQIRFMDAFLLYCLFEDSPECSDAEISEMDANKRQVILHGRDSSLELSIDGQNISFLTQANKVLEGVESVALRLDEAYSDEGDRGGYCAAVKAQSEKLQNSDLTPSGRILGLIEEGNEFVDLTMLLALEQKRNFSHSQLSVDAVEQYNKIAKESIAMQREIEESDQVSFDDYLMQYNQQH